LRIWRVMLRFGGVIVTGCLGAVTCAIPFPEVRVVREEPASPPAPRLDRCR
jgi:hypothetical protein